MRADQTMRDMRKALEKMAPSVALKICGPEYRVFDGKRYMRTPVPFYVREKGNNRKALKEYAVGHGKRYRIVPTHDICPYRYMLYTPR